MIVHTLDGEDVVLFECASRAKNLAAINSAILRFHVCYSANYELHNKINISIYIWIRPHDWCRRAYLKRLPRTWALREREPPTRRHDTSAEGSPETSQRTSRLSPRRIVSWFGVSRTASVGAPAAAAATTTTTSTPRRHRDNEDGEKQCKRNDKNWTN